ncbi:MAG: hypothetical protein II711_01905 [Clostridia bacterium]|nr:hypothetical protein [Clostridia bacterium]
MDLIDILFGAILGGNGRGGHSGSSSFIPSFGTLATVSTGTSWSGSDPYTSTVTVTGYTVTNKTMVSVLPSTDVVEQMAEDGITNIFITNNNGTLTATAVGATPTAAMTLQVLCTESDQSATISSLPGIVGNGVLETLQATDLTDAINKLGTAINGKQDKPATAGTAGQVLGLDNNLDPVWVNQSGGGGGTTDYAQLSNKPTINNVELSGNKTLAALGINAGSVGFDETGTYADGSIGAVVSNQKNAIDANEESIADTQSMIATVEATTTASKNYAVGDLLVYDGKLYKVTSAIATGATIIVGSNVTQTTVEDQLGSGGGSGGAVDDVQINGTSIVSGGVANIPLIDNNQFGMSKVDSTRGVFAVISGAKRGVLYVDKATSADIKNGTNQFKPPVPYNQHESVFYGLAKAAGDTTQSASANTVGTYTDDAKAAIQTMLGMAGIIGTVEGATASKAYAIGDAFLHSGALYKATASIASGDAITPGTNCTQTTLISIIKGE